MTDSKATAAPQTPAITPLRRLRIARGLTLREVAAAIDLDTGNLSRVEAGKQRSPEVAERLVRFYGSEAIDELQILYPERYQITEEAA